MEPINETTPTDAWVEGPEREQLVKVAQDLYSGGLDHDLEVDDDARVTPANTEAGSRSWWVQAWVYVTENDLTEGN